MKTAKQWQDELAGETSVESIREIQEDARRDLVDLIDAAWGIIANAGNGDWLTEHPEWQEAAAKWRDQFISAFSPNASNERRQEPPERKP